MLSIASPAKLTPTRRVAICYLPFNSNKGIPQLSQNRQFQWFTSPTYIYPVIPASAATLLKEKGHSVAWLDGIAENWIYDTFVGKLAAFRPDLIFIETKTPVIKTHWRQLKDFRQHLPVAKLVLAGDHVTAFPQESFDHSPVDFIITGGHYDFLLENLVNHLEKQTQLTGGIWYRHQGKIQNTGRFAPNQKLDRLPPIDRKLTRWQLYARKNGNFKYPPGAYTMAGRDCWWRQKGGCTFCSWTTLFPKFSVRTPNNLLDEIGQLIDLGAKEVFDDTGTFPIGNWLTEFCQGMIDRSYHQQIRFGCNMRFGALTQKDYELMARANFRLILYGLESANNTTIKRLNKGTLIEKIEPELETVQRANKKVSGHLMPHVTCMIGYPWETYPDAQNTVRLTQSWFNKGLIDSLQATIVIPYPGTKLFDQAARNGWLKTRNWDRYDMREPILKTDIPDAQLMGLARNIYTACLTPRFLIRQTFSIRSFSDFKYIINAGRKVLSHLLDFK